MAIGLKSLVVVHTPPLIVIKHFFFLEYELYTQAANHNSKIVEHKLSRNSHKDDENVNKVTIYALTFSALKV